MELRRHERPVTGYRLRGEKKPAVDEEALLATVREDATRLQEIRAQIDLLRNEEDQIRERIHGTVLLLVPEAETNTVTLNLDSLRLTVTPQCEIEKRSVDLASLEKSIDQTFDDNLREIVRGFVNRFVKVTRYVRRAAIRIT